MTKYSGDGGGISGRAHNLVIGDGDYVYVLTEKVYILHTIESDGSISYSHAPLCALAEGLFQKKETAIKYA